MPKKTIISIIKCNVGPPRMVALDLQVSNGKIASDDDGKPMIADLFDDPSSTLARH
jgi:fructose 1,6-bisphosphatase